MKKLSHLLKRLTLVTFALAFIFLPTPALAADDDGFGKLDEGFEGTVEASKPLSEGIRNIVNVFLSLTALAAGIMVVYGGVQYLTAGLSGDSDRSGKAKQTVIYAVIGLIVIGLSAVIVNFTLGAISGGN